MLIEASFTCAFCGQRNETTIDPSGGRTQNYTEDCQVCCRPNALHVHISAGGRRARIDAEREND